LQYQNCTIAGGLFYGQHQDKQGTTVLLQMENESFSSSYPKGNRQHAVLPGQA